MRPQILKDFQQFLLRGNVVDLAVAVVIGARVRRRRRRRSSPTCMTPLVAAIFGSHDFAA